MLLDQRIQQKHEGKNHSVCHPMPTEFIGNYTTVQQVAQISSQVLKKQIKCTK